MTAADQHAPFDAALTDAVRPWWMPATDDFDPNWHFHRSGEFPVLQDKALIEKEEPDA